MNRRTMLASLGMSSLAVPLLARSLGAAEGDADQQVEYLFVQSAHKATLADGELRLSGVSPATIIFSDRPERIAGHAHTEAFIGHWSEGKDSFESDPPNAAVSIADETVPEEIVVVLENPRLDGDTLTYDVDVLEGPETAEGGPVSLFIDIIGRPLTPLSFAGTARRVSRRTARRVYRRGW